MTTFTTPEQVWDALRATGHETTSALWCDRCLYGKHHMLRWPGLTCETTRPLKLYWSEPRLPDESAAAFRARMDRRDAALLDEAYRRVTTP